MRQKRQKKIETMRYVMLFLLVVYIVLLLLYSSGSTKDFDKVAEKFESEMNSETLKKQSAQAVKRYYGLNSADFEGVLLYTSRDSISAEEILIVKAKTDRQIQGVRDAIWNRIESRKDSFENIAPDQLKVLDKAQITVRGRYVFFVVSKDAQKYSTLFTNSL